MTMTPDYQRGVEAVEAVRSALRRHERAWSGSGEEHDALVAIVEAARALDTVAATTSAFLNPAPTPPPVADPGAVSEGDVERYARMFVDARDSWSPDDDCLSDEKGVRAVVAAVRAEATPPVDHCGATFDGAVCTRSRGHVRLDDATHDDGAGFMWGHEPAPPVDLDEHRAALAETTATRDALAAKCCAAHRERDEAREALRQAQAERDALLDAIARETDAVGESRTMTPAERVRAVCRRLRHCESALSHARAREARMAALREAVERVDNEEQRRRTWPALWHLHQVARALVDAPPPDAAGSVPSAEMPTEEEGREAAARLGIEVAAWAAEIRAKVDDAKAGRCTRPPVGWTCSRGRDHDGPCAASPQEPAEPVRLRIPFRDVPQPRMFFMYGLSAEERAKVREVHYAHYGYTPDGRALPGVPAPGTRKGPAVGAREFFDDGEGEG